MRETVINAWCDACIQDEDEIREPARYTYTIGMQQGETARPPLKVIELCEIHNKLMDELAMLLEATGQLPQVAAAAPAAARLQAVAPSKRGGGIGRAGTPETLASNPPVMCPIPGCGDELRKNSVTAHVWSRHLGGKHTQKAAPTRCPTCKEQPENMAMHRSAAHGYSALQEAIDTWNERNA